MNESEKLFEEYQRRLLESREKVASHDLFAIISSGDFTQKQMLRLLIEHSAHAQTIVRPVESWILGASYRCRELGMIEIAEYFSRHAQEEAGHDKMLEQDLEFLLELWNNRFQPHLCAEQIKCDRASNAMQGYVDLHEKTLKSPFPHMQIAIEFEIESLSPQLIPVVLEETNRLLGKEVASNLSFLGSHMHLDVFHTQANEKVFVDLLAARPQDLDLLVEVGRSALCSYGAILDQFVTLAVYDSKAGNNISSSLTRETSNQFLT